MLHTQADWLEFLRTASIKADQYVFTALEIENAILRAGMAAPKRTNPEQYCPRCTSSDPRSKFQHLNNEPLLSFGLYLPTK